MSFEYLVILGNHHSLCQKELVTVLERLGIKYSLLKQKNQVVYLQTETELNCPKLIHLLGGTVKIGKVGYIDATDLFSAIKSIIDQDSKNYDFGVSIYGREENCHRLIATVSSDLKKYLKSENISCRYLLPVENELSSVVVTKQKIHEFLCFFDRNWIVAETLVVQDFTDWNKRDYERPQPRPHEGMLPPKVARMMVNLALRTENEIVLDPFCGSGTILQEALGLGCRVIGSDLSQQVVKSCQKNLEWFSHEYGITSSYEIRQADAVKLEYLNTKISCIVTEPYLGPIFDTNMNQQQRLTIKKLENVITGLEKLYLGCLKLWQQKLTKDGIIVIVLPSYYLEGREYGVKKVIDNFSRLGYIIRAGPYPYYRPQALVRRNIYVLTNN